MAARPCPQEEPEKGSRATHPRPRGMDEADLQEPRHRAAGEAVQVRVGGALAVGARRRRRGPMPALFARDLGSDEEDRLGDVQVPILRRRRERQGVRGPVELVARQAGALPPEEESRPVGIVRREAGRLLERQPRDPGGRLRIDGDERAQPGPRRGECRGRPRFGQNVEGAPRGSARVIAEIVLSILGKGDEEERPEPEVLQGPGGETRVGGRPRADEQEVRPGPFALDAGRRRPGSETPIATGRHRRDSTRTRGTNLRRPPAT